MDYPKLRNVEIFPVEMNGENLICFRDPLKISENIVFLPQHVLPIISMFDGNHSIRDIQAQYMRAHGELLFTDQIIEVVTGLDEHYLLDTDRFRTHLQEVKDDFIQSPVRKAAVAGSGYDANPEHLRSLLDGFFLHNGGPGSTPQPQANPRGVKGFISPHIDLMRGGSCYAWAYKEVAEHSTEEVFVLLGTSHMPTERYFALTRKSFETPFGIAPVDQAIIGRLESTLGKTFFTDELVHRNEHSIEFQAVYLRYLFAAKKKFTIVPILCGSFHELIHRGTSPHGNDEIALFLDALRTAIAADDREVCISAAADLAHVGQQFGDRYQITGLVMERLRTKDLSMLEYVVKGDEEGFYDFIMREKDERKICGLPPIYAALRLLEDDAQGSLLNYHQWRDPAGAGAVTFASLAFH